MASIAGNLNAHAFLVSASKTGAQRKYFASNIVLLDLNLPTTKVGGMRLGEFVQLGTTQ
jgi:hypothetical protein